MLRSIAIVLLIISATVIGTLAQTENTLYSFKGGSDGANPVAGLVQDSKGNFYGTTAGPYDGSSDLGTVFKVSKTGAETVLHRFTGTPDGANPHAGLAIDASGNLYGTTRYGGAHGWGAVFKVKASGKETTLYSFTGGTDGGNPTGGLLLDNAGNLYGTTSEFGTNGFGTSLFGNIFKLDTAGHETVLYSFTGPPDGEYPQGVLLQDAAGNLYGTTNNGGYECGYRTISTCGTIFKLSPGMGGAWTETVLYRFTGGADGGYPEAGMVQDAAGNFYGTTTWGGIPGCTGFGCGTVFKLDTTLHETVPYSFTGGSDGAQPTGKLLFDSAGNLYGTTLLGGIYNSGTVFELKATGTETVLYNFTGGNDGSGPYADLIQDSAGNFYSTTVYGGASGVGVVFEIPTGSATVPYWTRSFKYGTYRMVGTNPFKGSATTTVPTEVLPFKTIFANGVTLDGSDELQSVENSPLYVNATFSSGTTQYADAMQRAEFWNPVVKKTSPNYHVLLGAPAISSTISVDIPSQYGTTCEGTNGTTFGVVNYDWFKEQLDTAITSENYSPSSLVIALTRDTVLTTGSLDCGPVTYIGGYHRSLLAGVQINTYAYATYLDPGWFNNAGVVDIFFLSHEVAEWMNDPFVDLATGQAKQNLVPAWLEPGGSTCNNLLEVGDATENLSGAPILVTANGVNYHVTDVAGLSFFSRQANSMEEGSTKLKPSYSYNGEITTFSSDCPTGSRPAVVH